MLTLDDFVQRELIRPLTAPAFSARRVVADVLVEDETTRRRARAPRPVRDALVITSCVEPAPPQTSGALTEHRRQAEQVLIRLTQQRAAGVVALGEAAEALSSIRSSLPLYEPANPRWSADDLQARILRAQASAAQDASTHTDALLAAAARAARTHSGPDEILKITGEITGARVDLLSRADFDAFARGEDDLAAALGRLMTAGDQPGAASIYAWSGQDRHIVLHRLADSDRILAADRTTPWPQDARRLLTHATHEVAALLRPSTLRVEHELLQATATAVRVALVEDLLRGDTSAASAKADLVAPGFEGASRLVFGVLRCAAEDLATVREDCESRLPDALLAPADTDGELNILDPATLSEQTAAALAPLVVDGRRLGLSTPTAWDQTAEARDAARRALERTTSARPVRVDHGRPTSLADALPAWARTWAHELLRPLDRLTAHEREHLIHTATLALSLGSTATARRLGMDTPSGRNRVADTVASLASTVGLTTSRSDRPVLYLALALAALPPATETSSQRPTLADLLDSQEARTWATELLCPLSPADLETVERWIGQPTHNDAARRLGVTRRTLTNRLRRLGTRLGRPLSGAPPWDGQHDVALALAITTSHHRHLNDPLARPTAKAPASPGVFRPSGPLPGPAAPASRARLIMASADGKGAYPSDLALLAAADEHCCLSHSLRAGHQSLLGAIRWATGTGIDQVLVVGHGLPQHPQGDPHDVAHASRVLYLDDDPMATTHLHALVRAQAGVHLVDLTDPESALRGLADAGHLDLHRPVLLVLPLASSRLSAGATARWMDPLARGSLLALTHATAEPDPRARDGFAILISAGMTIRARTGQEIAALLDGYEILPPGIVSPDEWMHFYPENSGPDLPHDDYLSTLYMGIARKP